MAVLKDFNHVIDFKFGHKIDKFRLIPDTGLNEVAVQTHRCEGCSGPAGDNKYQPTNAPQRNATQTIDYFFLLHMFEVELKGAHYKERACIVHDPSPAVCLMNFHLFGISSVDTFFYANGDGYLGLGIGEGEGTLGDNDKLSFMAQLKKHNLIEKNVFSVYTQMNNSTDNPS
jgi:hypothetical protein